MLESAIAAEARIGFSRPTAARDRGDVVTERPAEVLLDRPQCRAAQADRVDGRCQAAWRVLDRHSAIAQATAEQLPADAITETHAAAFRPVTALVARGRREGVFRTDVPARCLVTSFFALMHACGDEVRAGRLKAADAPRILQATLRDLAQAK